jgi:hypothetical protein
MKKLKQWWLESKREQPAPPEPIPAPEPETPREPEFSDFKSSTKALRFNLTDDDDRTMFCRMVGEFNTTAVNFRIRQEKFLVWMEL